MTHKPSAEKIYFPEPDELSHKDGFLPHFVLCGSHLLLFSASHSFASLRRIISPAFFAEIVTLKLHILSRFTLAPHRPGDFGRAPRIEETKVDFLRNVFVPDCCGKKIINSQSYHAIVSRCLFFFLLLATKIN